MFKRTLCVILALLLITLLFVSCKPSISSYAGKYYTADGDELTITKDGIFYGGGLSGQCILNDDEIAFTAGMLSSVYQIERENGHILLVREGQSTYVEENYYDEYLEKYLAEQKKTEEENLKKEQDRLEEEEKKKNEHVLTGQYRCAVTHMFGTDTYEIIEFSSDWTIKSSTAMLFDPNVEQYTRDYDGYIFFSFIDEQKHEVIYYNNSDVENWDYKYGEQGSTSIIDSAGDVIPYEVYRYQPLAAPLTGDKYDYDIETGTYTICVEYNREFTLEGDKLISTDKEIELTPQQLRIRIRRITATTQYRQRSSRSF